MASKDTTLEAFRRDVRGWISSNQVLRLRDLHGPEHRSTRLHLRFGVWVGGNGSLGDDWSRWVERNERDGFICPWWPNDAGGQGWDPIQQMVWNEELLAAGMPRVSRGLGEHLVGPAVFLHGTPEQRDRFLPPILDGEDIYVQGFSEPDAGSDLASLRTVGVVDGDELVITGQKVWTTVGQVGNRMFLLCRTDPAGPRHRGISFVLLDLVDNKSVDVRPTRQMTGDSEFTEEFLTEARAPLFNVIGGLHNGWRVTMSTLGLERGGDATTAHLALAKQLNAVIDAARRSGQSTDPVLRQLLMRSYTDVELMRFGGARVGGIIAAAIAGDEAMQQQIERVASASKLTGAEVEQHIADLAIRVRGMEGLIRPDGSGYPTDETQYELLWSRALTIQGGSAEIQRNILAERALGLPKEPAGL
jgi:alkylation response protein AidB-like acyl-CoA dehydrogenase